MGYYIETGGISAKAEWLVNNVGGKVVSTMYALDAFHQGLGVVCVVDNGPFEAAAYICDEQDFNMFANPYDRRKKTWVVMDKQKAEELSGYSK